jgi:hypothetical protein
MTQKKTTVRKKISKVVKAYGNTWEDVFPGTKQDVKAAERALGVAFPKELAELFMTCGGGLPENDYYYDSKYDLEISMGYVFPLKDQKDIQSVVSQCELFRKVHDLSKSLIPFAYDSGNANLMCLDLVSGKVVYFLHDEEPEDAIQIVSSSLIRFLKGLRECPF